MIYWQLLGYIFVAGYTAIQLRCAGFDAEALRLGGFTVLEVSSAGFPPNKLMEAGFSAQELQSDLHLDLAALKTAGYDVEDLRVSYIVSNFN